MYTLLAALWKCPGGGPGPGLGQPGVQPQRVGLPGGPGGPGMLAREGGVLLRVPGGPGVVVSPVFSLALFLAVG